MKKTLSGMVLATLLFSSSTFAGLEQIAVIPVDGTMGAEKIAMPVPTYGNAVTYKYDEKAFETLYNKESSLIEVVCQSEDVFKNLGINANAIKINTIGFSKNNLDITVDAKNCSLYAGRSTWTQPSQGTTDAKALSAAQEFVDSILGAKGIVSVPALGKPTITMRDNGGSMYPNLKESDMKSNSALSHVDLISSSTGEKIDVQYNSITVLYPYIVGDTSIYNNYGGGKMGVLVTIDGNGVSYVNVPLLTFKGISKTAEKNTLEGTKKFISQGGNNPYYGSNGAEAIVKLQAPERVLVYFNYYTPNASTPRVFLSDGVRFGSSLKQDQWNPQNYEMIISDFIIGNNSNPVLSEMTASATSSIKKSTLLKRKIGVKKKSM